MKQRIILGEKKANIETSPVYKVLGGVRHMKKFLVTILSVIALVSSTMPLPLLVAAAVQTAPSGLTATAASATQVDLAWTDNSDNETSFRIERSLDNFFTPSSANFTASANAISLSDTTVVRPNTYYYRVVAVNDAEDSTPSNVAIVKVDVPNAPSNLSATIMSATRVDLIWTDQSNDESGFRIERSLDGFATAPSSTFNAAANARTFADSTVLANNTYSYRIIAINVLGDSAASNVTTVRVTNKLQAGPIDPAFIFNGDPNTSFPGYFQDDQGTRVALLPGEPGQAIDPPDPNNPYQVFLNMGEEGFYYLAESSMADMDGTGPGGKLVTVFATEANVDVPGTEVVFGRIRIFAQVPAAGVYLFQHPWGEDTIEVTQDDVASNRGIRFTEDIGLAERTFNLVGNSRINRFLRQTVPPPPTGWIGDGVTAGPVTGSPIGFNKIRLTAPVGVNLDGAGHNFVESSTFTVAARLQTTIAPVPSFSVILDPASGIASVSANFTDASANAPTGWLWDFGDGSTSTSQNPVHVYNSAGSYTVTLTATNAAGSASTSQKVNVYSAPAASFIHAVPNGLPPVSVSFTDNSTGNIAFWSWDFGDGGTSALENPSHTYASAGIYSVNLTVRNPSGTASVAHALRISANLIASFTTSISPANGIAPVSANFTDTSTGVITSWLWDFGDGTTATSQNATKTYNAAGDYVVTLTVTDAAGESATSQTVSVYTLPAASFTKSAAQGAPPLTVSLTDTSTGNPSIWLWNFGDGATSTLQNPTHVYETLGEYNIALGVTNVAGMSFTSQTVIATGLRPEIPMKLQVGPIDQNFIFQGDPNTSFPTYYQDDEGTRVALLPGAPGQTIDPPDPNNPYQVFLGMGEEGFYFLAESGFADMDGVGPGGKLVTVFAVEANVAGPGSEVVFTRVRIVAQVPVPGAYVFQHPYGTESLEVTQEDIDGGRAIFFTRDIGLAERDFFTAAGGDIQRFLHQANPPAGFIGNGTVGPVTGSPTGFNKVRLTGPAGVNLDGAGNNFVESDQFTVSARVVFPIVPSLAAPTGLRATVPAGTRTVNLVWTDNSDNETVFRIERSLDNFATPPSFSANVTANVAAFTDIVTGVGGLMSYRVIAVNALGDSMASNVVPVAIVPAAPTALTATIISATRVDLAWTDNADDETGFRIQRSTNGGAFAVVGSVAVNVANFSDLTVAINNTYDYRVVAFNAGGDSAPSNVAQVVVVVPAAPSGLSVTGVTDNQVDLTWTDNSTNELGFRIERATNSTFTAGLVTATVGVNVATYSDTAATSGTRLFYRVLAVNNVGDSPPSNVVDVTTAPARPGNLIITRADLGRVEMTWTDNSPNESGFRVQRARNDAFDQNLVEVTVPANTTSRRDQSVGAGGTFFYRVVAFNTATNSPPTNVVSVTLPVPTTPPQAPTDLTATAGPGPQVILTWRDRSNNEEIFRIMRSTSGGSFVEIATMPTDVASFSDTTVAWNTSFAYQVIAANIVGPSGASNTVQITIGGVVGGTSTVASTPVTLDGLKGKNPLTVDTSGKVQTAVTLESTSGKPAFNLDIPAGTAMTTATGTPLTSITVTVPASPPPPPPQNTVVLTQDFGPDGATFNPPINLSFKFDPAKLPAGVTEANLTIAYWNGSAWTTVPATIDTNAKVITASVSHFTIFAVMAKEAPAPSPVSAPVAQPSPSLAPVSTPTPAPAPVPSPAPVLEPAPAPAPVPAEIPVGTNWVLMAGLVAGTVLVVGLIGFLLRRKV